MSVNASADDFCIAKRLTRPESCRYHQWGNVLRDHHAVPVKASPESSQRVFQNMRSADAMTVRMSYQSFIDARADEADAPRQREMPSRIAMRHAPANAVQLFTAFLPDASSVSHNVTVNISIEALMRNASIYELVYKAHGKIWRRDIKFSLHIGEIS